MVRTWSLFCFPNCNAEWDLESLCPCFLCEKIIEPLLHVSVGLMFLRSLCGWCYCWWHFCTGVCRALSPGAERFWIWSHLQLMMGPCGHCVYTAPLIYSESRFMPKSLLLDITVRYQLRMWGGVKAASPCTPTGPSSAGQQQLSIKKKPKEGARRQGQGLVSPRNHGSCAWKGAFPKYQLCCRNGFQVVWNNISD